MLIPIDLALLYRYYPLTLPSNTYNIVSLLLSPLLFTTFCFSFFSLLCPEITCNGFAIEFAIAYKFSFFQNVFSKFIDKFLQFEVIEYLNNYV